MIFFSQGDWGPWGNCPVCGPGLQNRTRPCLTLPAIKCNQTTLSESRPCAGNFLCLVRSRYHDMNHEAPALHVGWASRTEPGHVLRHQLSSAGSLNQGLVQVIFYVWSGLGIMARTMKPLPCMLAGQDYQNQDMSYVTSHQVQAV